jgi:hypothetical protein
MKESTLLKLHVKLEAKLPRVMMWFVGLGFKVIVDLLWASLIQSLFTVWIPWIKYMKICFFDTLLSICGNPLMAITGNSEF